jgi:hypothetical protein
VADDTKKPAEAKPTTPPASPTAAARAKSVATKPAARARTAPAAAPAARKRASATAKAPIAATKKTSTRPPVARKSPPVKKAVHEPEPFAAKGNKAGKPAKAKKAKLIRDSFTMPDGEYALIAALKKRCLEAGVSAKKSEILRAAVANLAKLSDASVVAAVRRLEVIKTGRPAKGSK